jgi:hypothetical protein
MTNIELLAEVERQASTFPAVYLTREQVSQLRAMTSNCGANLVECGWADEPVYRRRLHPNHRGDGKPFFENVYASCSRVTNADARKACHYARVYLASGVAEKLTQ